MSWIFIRKRLKSKTWPHVKDFTFRPRPEFDSFTLYWAIEKISRTDTHTHALTYPHPENPHIEVGRTHLKKYQRFRILRRAEGKNSNSKTFRKSQRKHFTMVFLLLFCCNILYSLLQTCILKQLIFTHFIKPNLFTGLKSLGCGSIFTIC